MPKARKTQALSSRSVQHKREPDHRAAALAALGVLSVLAAQFILVRTNSDRAFLNERQAAVLALLTAGALLFGYGSQRLQLLDTLPRAKEPGHPGMSTLNRRGWLSLAAAGVLSIGGLTVFSVSGENGVVRWLWLLSVASVLVAGLMTLPRKWPRLEGRGIAPLLVLAVLLGAALWTRTYQLPTLPYNVDPDFAAEGIQARALATGQQPGWFQFGDRTAPMLNFFPAAITMRLFGADLVGLNASGVIEGLLTILGVYLLGTELFNKRVGLLAAALLLVSYAHLAASRQSGYIDPVFYMTYATYFGVAGLKRQEGGPMLASGFFSALCLQSYWSGRLIIPLFAVVLLGLLVFQRSWLFSRRWQLLLWGIAVLVTTGPMLLVFARQPTPLTSHAQQISLFSPRIMGHMQSVYRVDTQEEVLFEQARRTVFALHYYPDTGTQFSFRRPFLDCITASLFTLGCGFMLFRLRNPGAAMLLAWMLLGTVFGIFLGENPPYWGRLMILLPAIAVIAATSLDATSRFLERTLPVRRRATELTMAAAALLLFVYLGVSNWQTYVNVSATYATPRARIGRYLAQLPDAENAHLVTSLGWRIDELEFEFLAPGRLSRSLAPEELQHLLSAGALDGVLILTGELTEVANALPSVLPGGALAAIAGNTEGEVAFYVYRIP